MHIWLVVSNIFYFHAYLGKIPILTNIFQRGWSHQLGFLEVTSTSLVLDDWPPFPEITYHLAAIFGCPITRSPQFRPFSPPFSPPFGPRSGYLEERDELVNQELATLLRLVTWTIQPEVTTVEKDGRGGTHWCFFWISCIFFFGGFCGGWESWRFVRHFVVCFFWN